MAKSNAAEKAQEKGAVICFPCRKSHDGRPCPKERRQRRDPEGDGNYTSAEEAMEYVRRLRESFAQESIA